jgi:hypothetical protein
MQYFFNIRFLEIGMIVTIYEIWLYKVDFIYKI